MLDVDRLIDGIHDYLGKAIAPLAERLSEIEKRQPEKGDRGADGADGKDGANGIDGKDGERGAQGQQGLPGEKGADGVAGKDGQPGAIGDRGEKGADGLAGRDGERGLQGERGSDGAAGRDGANGLSGKDGERGLQGENGIDGTSVTVEQVIPLLEASVTKWMLDWERRAQDTLAKAIERVPLPKDGKDGTNGSDGAAGKDGRDAFSLEDFQAKMVGRTLTLTLGAGAMSVERHIEVAGLPQYVGTFVSGGTRKHGDMVTYGGSVWLATRDTDNPPPGEDWRLVVKGTR